MPTINPETSKSQRHGQIRPSVATWKLGRGTVNGITLWGSCNNLRFGLRFEVSGFRVSGLGIAGLQGVRVLVWGFRVLSLGFEDSGFRLEGAERTKKELGGSPYKPPNLLPLAQNTTAATSLKAAAQHFNTLYCSVSTLSPHPTSLE